MNTAPNAASSLYCELSEAELAQIVASSLQTRVLSHALMSGGLFNTTYLVDTESFGKAILRAGPINRQLLMPFEHRLMEAEAQVYSLLAAHGVPASEILAMDLSKRIVDRDFMLVRYIPSRAMGQCALTDEDRARISRDIGAATARMHAIRGPRFGRIADVRDGGGHSKWSECLYGELLSWETVGVPAALFSAEEHRELRRLFRACAPYLDEITVPQLVHTDLWLGNILVRTDTERPEFGAIIDADRAIWGDPMYEFSSIQWTYGEPAFWAGYGRPLPQGKGDQIRRTVYTLFNRLLDGYVYIGEYNNPEQARAQRALALEGMHTLRQLLGEAL